MEAKTGEVCPQGGTWALKSDKTVTRSIGIGNKMPPHPDHKTAVTWVLVKKTGG